MERRDYKGSGRVKILAGTAAALFVGALIGSIFVLRPPRTRVAEVVQDDTVLYAFDLDVAQDQVITVSYPGGSSNTIRIENGEIWVETAECPDRTCVKMGKLHSANLPIVCLPNHLIIRFAE